MPDPISQTAEVIQDLFNQAPCGYHCLDRNGTFVHINDTELQWLGYTRDELVGRKKIQDLLAPESLRKFDEYFPVLKSIGIVRDVEIQVVRKDGSILPVWLTASAVFDDRGQFVMSRSTLYDATGRRRHEQAWLRLAAIVDSSEDAIIGETEDRVVMEWNPSAEAIFGYTADEMRGRPYSLLVPPERLQEYETNTVRARKGEGIRHFETVRLRKDGRRIHVFLTVSPIKDPQGVLLGFSTIARDITASKAAELALQASERNYRELMEAAPDGILKVDQRGQIILMNQAAERMFGYGRAELIGKSVETLVPGGSRGFHKGHRETYNRDPRVRPMGIGLELRAQTKSGALLPVEISLSPGHEDSAPAVIAVVRDVTERSRVEEKLRRSEEKLRQAEKLEALARLAGGTAHEFNNLLTMIMGYAELLEADFSGQERSSGYLQKIRLSSKRAANLTRQLLAFGRRQMLSPQVLDMNAIITDAGQVLSRVMGQGTKTLVVTAPRPAWVRADAAQIEQMIANLASNAADAMPHGGTLSISLKNLELVDDDVRQHHGLSPGPYVLLSFADTGVGMPPEVQARIFEPFFSTREVGKAAGLGLATVYGIVTQSGGTISVHSQLGVGTVFNVYLPRLTEEQAALRAAVPPTMEEMAGSGTILLVEDQPHLLELSREFLQRLGYVVLPASNAEQAIDIAGSFQGRLDLLLTDIVMPGMNGRQLSNQLRAARPGMKVLYVSGYTDEVFGEQGISSGEAFMEKPFDLETLGQKVKQVLRPAPGQS